MKSLIHKIFRTGSGKRGSQSSLFHVTHPKAGSSWLYRIFKKAYRDRVPRRAGEDLARLEEVPNGIYSAIFCDYAKFREIPFSANQPHFFVIRELRDTLVSLYFSHRYSHVPNPSILKSRSELESMSEEDGLRHYFETRAEGLMRTQESWIRSGAPVYRYEDLFESEGQLLHDILEEVGFKYDRDHLDKHIRKHTFQKEFGREPGETDINSHGRSGIAGSWQDYRSKELDEIIERDLAAHIKMTGYPL